MSTESVKGSNGEASDPSGENESNRGKQTPDSDGEIKIRVDVEEHEKGSPRASASRSDGRRSGSPGRQSRSGSGERQPGSRPRSTASGEERMFEAKPKKKTKPGDLDPDGHEVTFTVTISIAVPTGEISLD